MIGKRVKGQKWKNIGKMKNGTKVKKKLKKKMKKWVKMKGKKKEEMEKMTSKKKI